MADQPFRVSVNVEAAIARRLHQEAGFLREKFEAAQAEATALLERSEQARDPDDIARLREEAGDAQAYAHELQGRIGAMDAEVRKAIESAESLDDDTDPDKLEPETIKAFTQKEIKQHERETLELAWINLRADRDALLRASDWTQGLDVPAEIAEAWASYRQKLRDLPAKLKDPTKANWPEPPNA